MTTAVVGELELATIIQKYNDVTERMKRSHELLGSEVARLRDELDEKNRALARRERLAALGEMAAGVAHEIRNPLGGVGLYASLLERDLEDNPEQLDIAKRIGVGVRNMEGIVGDILAFAGDAEPRRQRVRLAEILDSALTQVSPQMHTMHVEIDADLRLTQVELDCDPRQIERALVNLILNAIEAAEKGGRVWVRAGKTPSNDNLFAVIVEDNGPGIPEDQLHRVFNPFFTTKHTGTGLGLAIVHRIAESHGGSVVAGTRAGGGAAFVLLLPKVVEDVGFRSSGGEA
jgi:signal transduction histidine kinase